MKTSKPISSIKRLKQMDYKNKKRKEERILELTTALEDKLNRKLSEFVNKHDDQN